MNVGIILFLLIGSRPLVVIIIEDFEAFLPQILKDLILSLRYYLQLVMYIYNCTLATFFLNKRNNFVCFLIVCW